MAIGVILGIIFVVACIGCCVWAYNAFENCNQVTGTIAVVLAIALAFTFIFVPFSFHTVDTGEIAVVKRLGEAKHERTAGTHFDWWFINSYQIYDSKVQNVDIATAAYSSDAQTMDIAMTMQYQILSDKATDIAKQYGSLDALQNRIQAIAIEKVKAVLSSYKAMDIIADRSAMSPAVEEAIRNAIGEDYYVNIVAVVLTNIDFSDAFETAVEDKMIAEQKQLKAEYENQTKVDKAKADAEAKLVAAKAEAEANKLLEKSLTDKILHEMYLEKWDGVLPEVVAGEDTGIMFSLDDEE